MENRNMLDILRPLLQELYKTLTLQVKYQPNLKLPAVTQDCQEVTTGMRDGTAHVLRCLKVWYDLPSDVLFISANLMDRFLTKIKVKPKHMACLSVASFQLACQMVCGDSAPDPTDILAISQCNRTLGDLNRMLNVITNKLGASQDMPPVTPIVFLRLFHAFLSSVDVDQIYTGVVNESEMLHRLEVLACDAASSNFRPCEVALVLISSQVDSGVARMKPSPSANGVLTIVSFLSHLQQVCQISDAIFYACHSVVLDILARYNAESQIPHRQRLVWKLSNRTLRYLRPTERLVTTLQTIDEHGQLQIRRMS